MARNLSRVAMLLTGGGLGGIGLAGLIGWATGIRVLVEVSPTFPTLHYVTAAAFLLAGIALIVRSLELKHLSGIFGSAIVAISSIVLMSLFTARQADPFARIFAALGFSIDLTPTARVAPNTAIALLATGMALVIAAWFRGRSCALIVSTLGAVVAALGTIASIGYLTGVAPLYGWSGFYEMSIQAAVALVLSGIGIQALAACLSADWGPFLAQKWLVIPVFTAIEVATICLALSMYSQVGRATEDHIDAHALAFQIGLTEKVRADIAAIERMANRWSGDDAKSKRIWEADASLHQMQMPGVASIAWVDRDLITRWVIPASARAVAVGNYVGFEPNRLRTIDAARTSKHARITPTVDLFIGGPGVIMFCPIFYDEKFSGFISAAYRPAALLESIAKEALLGEFSVVALDGDRMIYRHLADNAPTSEEWGNERLVELPGMTWRVRIWPSAAFLAAEHNSLPVQTLLGGTVFGLLLTLLVSTSQRAYGRQLVIEETATELQTKVAELAVAKQAAEAANVAKTMFLSSISHDIRSPLGAVIGYVDLLNRSGQFKAENATYLEIIKRNGQNLLLLINDILDLAKVESGNLACERTTVEFHDLLLDVLTTLGHVAAEKGLQLVGRFESPVPASIETDRLRVRQILINLIGNAIKFTAKGSVAVQVKLIPGSKGALIQVEVSDTGCGIPLNRQHHLFEPFTQGDPSVNRLYGGTGLGLSLSRQLARALGGDIHLKQSKIGEGSTFVMTFDAGRFDSRGMIPPGDICSRAPLAQRDLTVSRRLSLRGTTVLLVDDSADMRLLTRTILQANGATVEEAKDGREAIDKALDGRHDIVLMDLQMPILDGEHAIQELRSRGYSKPVIALTANAMQGERERGLALGFSDYLCKPVLPDSLIDTILKHVQRKPQGLPISVRHRPIDAQQNSESSV